MKKTNQKLVIIYGSHNSGKTFLYNLFKRNGSYKSIDFHANHYKGQYEKSHNQNLLDQFNKEIYERLKKHIFSEKTFSLNFLFEEIGNIMKRFPDYNIVIKPGQMNWLLCYDSFYDDWFKNINSLTPLKIENVIHLYAIRHPKISLATTYSSNTDIEDFIQHRKLGDYYNFKNVNDICNIIKIEDIKRNKLMKSLLKNINLAKLKTYTEFDLNDYRTNIFKNFNKFKSDLKVIDLELKEMLDFLNYSTEDRYVAEYLKDLYKIANPDRIEGFDKINLLSRF